MEMLEVVFGESMAGALSVALGRGSRIGGAFSVTVIGGGELSREEQKRLQREAEARERRNWEQAVPLEGDQKDILCFPLALSTGEITEAGIGPQREAALRRLMGVFPEEREEAVRGMMETSCAALTALLEQGSVPLRVWSSAQPDEACGLCWLMEQLRPVGWERLDVTCVRLPELEERPDGVIVRYHGWGDVEPYQLGRLAARGRKLSPAVMRMCAERWRELQRENAPLRAVLSGQLMSVPENVYDSFLLRELDECEEEFREAQLIGRVLGKYPLGFGDAWLTLRIEELLRAGRLEAVTDAEAGAPVYHRLLRKRGTSRGQ